MVNQFLSRKEHYNKDYKEYPISPVAEKIEIVPSFVNVKKYDSWKECRKTKNYISDVYHSHSNVKEALFLVLGNK